MKLISNQLLRPLLALAISLHSLHVTAGDAPGMSGYQLAVIKDGAHGVAVVNGEFDAALPRLQRHSATRFDSSTNLCVALTKLGKLEEANTAFMTAYTLAKKSEFSRDRAIALSNLGVVSALRGEFVTAKTYFQRALQENAEVTLANDNLVLLQQRGATNA